MDERPIRDVGLPPDCLIVMVARAGREIVPSGETRLQRGDHVTVMVSGDAPESCAQVQALARHGH